MTHNGMERPANGTQWVEMSYRPMEAAQVNPAASISAWSFNDQIARKAVSTMAEPEKGGTEAGTSKRKSSPRKSESLSQGSYDSDYLNFGNSLTLKNLVTNARIRVYKRGEFTCHQVVPFDMAKTSAVSTSLGHDNTQIIEPADLPEVADLLEGHARWLVHEAGQEAQALLERARALREIAASSQS